WVQPPRYRVNRRANTHTIPQTHTHMESVCGQLSRYSDQPIKQTARAAHTAHTQPTPSLPACLSQQPRLPPTPPHHSLPPSLSLSLFLSLSLSLSISQTEL